MVFPKENHTSRFLRGYSNCETALTSDLQEVFCVNIVAITGVNRVHPFTVFTHSVAVTIACED